MTYGFNPVLPAYADTGSIWRSGDPVDLKVFGVSGYTWIVGIGKVHVPAGFRALQVRSVLTQKGHPFGSGVRTMWFAANVGLVKLGFQHRDGSTTLVQMQEVAGLMARFLATPRTTRRTAARGRPRSYDHPDAGSDWREPERRAHAL